MWFCPVCRNENADALAMCWMCGAHPGDKEVPIELTPSDLLFGPPPKSSRPKAAGVTRRFSVGTMMILMTFFAVLFSGLKLLGASPPIFAGVTVFFLGIGAAQMFFSKNLSPRMVSFISGIVMGMIGSGAAIAVAAVFPNENKFEFEGVTAFCFFFFIFGGPLGYLAGGLIAGIFLFREREERAAADAEINQEQ